MFNLNYLFVSITVEDATKNLKILTSKNSSIVQKRQLMRTTFGDYRKKMSDEEKKYNKGNIIKQKVHHRTILKI